MMPSGHERLDAGNSVSFGRDVGEAARGRLFIDWRRGPDVVLPPGHHRGFALPSMPFSSWMAHPAGPGGAGGRMFLQATTPASVYDYDAYQYQHQHHHQRRHIGYDGYGAAPGRQVLFYQPQQQYHRQHQSLVLESVPVRMAAAPGLYVRACMRQKIECHEGGDLINSGAF
ncbi:B3 domain-containing protein [Hordeum vulgare]|nr:B3 domain-containing protein [Hordeum vulgare]